MKRSILDSRLWRAWIDGDVGGLEVRGNVRGRGEEGWLRGQRAWLSWRMKIPISR